MKDLEKRVMIIDDMDEVSHIIKVKDIDKVSICKKENYVLLTIHSFSYPELSSLQKFKLNPNTDINRLRGILCDALEGKEPIRDGYMEEFFEKEKLQYAKYIHDSRVFLKTFTDEKLLKLYNSNKGRIKNDYLYKNGDSIYDEENDKSIPLRVILEEMNERNFSTEVE